MPTNTRSRLILPPGYQAGGVNDRDDTDLGELARAGELGGGMGVDTLEPDVPDDVLPDDGIVDLVQSLQLGGSREGFDEFVGETNRIHSLLRDDPAPEVEFLQARDDDIVAVFEARLRHAAEYREPREKKWRKAWLDYNQQLDGDVDKWKSKVFLPLIYTLVSSGVPAAVAAAFDSGSLLKVMPEGQEDEENAETLTRLLDHFMRTKMPARREIRDWLWYAYLFGTGILRVGWRYEARLMRVPIPVYDIDPMTGAKEYLGNRLVQKVVTTHDEPELEAIDIWNAFPCPWTTKGDRRVPYFIDRIETTEEDFLELARQGGLGEEGYERVQRWLDTNPILDLAESTIYSNLGGRALALQEVGLASPYEQYDGADEDLDRGPRPLVAYRMTTRDYEVYISGDGSRMVLGKQSAPYIDDDLPYVFFHFDRTPKDPWGRGMGEIAGPIQSQINFDFNHHNDSRRIRLNAPLKVRRFGNSLVEGDLEMKPGKLIKVMEMTDVEALEIPDTTGDMVAHQSLLIDHANKATGISNFTRGFSEGGANTATEATIQDSATSLRRTEHISELAAALQAVGRRLIKRCQQFVTKDQAIRIAGAPALSWETVSPEDLLGEFDVVASPSLLKSNPELLRRDWGVLFPMLAAHPMVKQDELLRRVLAAYEQERLEELIQVQTEPMDPLDEEIALDVGVEVPVSMDEDFRQHLMVHQQKLMMLEAQPVPDARAIAAHRKHLKATLAMMNSVQMMLQAGAKQAAGGGGGGGPGKKTSGNGSVTREKATRAGEAQGSHGSGGRAPGPVAPGRKS